MLTEVKSAPREVKSHETLMKSLKLTFTIKDQLRE